MAKPKHPSKQDYAKLGKAVGDVMVDEYFALRNRRQIWWDSFIKGVLGGFGGVLGATILVAIMLWLLSLFTKLPVLNHVSDAIRNAISGHH